MLYPYMTIGDDFEVTQTPWNKDGYTMVHFEKPDAVYCFKTMDCTVPYYRVSGIVGFTEVEVAELVEFCRCNADLLILGAKTGGGINNA